MSAHFLNSLDPGIKFTTEEEQNRSLPFLDTLTVIREDGSLQIRISRKPPHTDQYLNFDSNHPLDHKLGVIRTVFHRANTIVSDQDLETEKSLLTQALKTCGYPQWAIHKATCSKPPNTKPSAGTKSKGVSRPNADEVPPEAEPLKQWKTLPPPPLLQNPGYGHGIYLGSWDFGSKLCWLPSAEIYHATIPPLGAVTPIPGGFAAPAGLDLL
ncbi:hypothetical protein Bbelb_025030 [Branchiostoma belcheri]|nr:hypothetical protein Bbelb_025030 [Branchiostoma belcheri]